MLYDFMVKRNDGSQASLADFKGQVLLLVNTASECGLTPQYDGLEKLYQQYQAKGLNVLGFPANEFGAQEPGSDTQIAEFCKLSYGVKFPLMAKSVVKGEGQSPLYGYLTKESPFPGDITWNFEKFLVGRSGQVVARFSPKVDPLAPEVVEAIERELAQG
ncbi:MAG: glutathione peroxidase [Cyanobacteria bacterium RYN_339]|nr:glutathione peroxidase [Cyanobacteria bacterium RYN_339]